MISGRNAGQGRRLAARLLQQGPPSARRGPAACAAGDMVALMTSPMRPGVTPTSLRRPSRWIPRRAAVRGLRQRCRPVSRLRTDRPTAPATETSSRIPCSPSSRCPTRPRTIAPSRGVTTVVPSQCQAPSRFSHSPAATVAATNSRSERGRRRRSRPLRRASLRLPRHRPER
jgi:hypothetical protein